MSETAITFPKEADQGRLDQYEHYESLYNGDHFSAFKIKAEREVSAQYSRLRYIVANFPGLLTRVMADMLFGENVVVDFEDEKTQEYADEWAQKNHLLVQLFESSIDSSKLGGVVLKLYIGKRNPLDKNAENEIILESVNPKMYFPEFDGKSAKNTPSRQTLIHYIERDGKTYLHKEIHEPRKIINEVYLYNKQEKKIEMTMNPKDFGLEPQEDTKTSKQLVIFVPNFRDGSGFFGTSDYADLDSLFYAINNRITKIDNILDKHSDPILAVPPGVIDEDGKVRKEALGMFEVDNENPGFNKPEYIVWNANVESAFKEIDKLVDFMFMFSEIAPATLGMDKNGIAESGRALKFRLLATIRKRNRKIRYYDQAIKDLFETMLELAKAWSIDVGEYKASAIEVERPSLSWGDGVINDEVEMIDNAGKRIDQGTWSKADAIANLDDISPDEAKEKVKEIEEENAPAVGEIQNNLNANDAMQKGKPMSQTQQMMKNNPKQEA